jgi:hypothetical protein
MSEPRIVPTLADEIKAQKDYIRVAESFLEIWKNEPDSPHYEERLMRLAALRQTLNRLLAIAPEGEDVPITCSEPHIIEISFANRADAEDLYEHIEDMFRVLGERGTLSLRSVK